MTRTATRGCRVAEHPVVLLDTSVVIAPPSDLRDVADQGAISVLTIAELANGLTSVSDPVEQARRRARLETVLSQHDPIAYTASAAVLYGALCDTVRRSGRNPRGRRLDLMLASVAGDLGVPILTRNPDDFRGIHDIIRVVEVA